jgi:cellulose synthase/poly-beta-1,6-N-acetylglucosamine synthase-like glycosyltransferase
LDLAAAGLRGSCVTVSVRLPDGRLEALPDAPLLLAKAVPAVGNADAPPATSPSLAAALSDLAPVAIVVPVYRGRDETLACLESVLATIDRKTRLVVVNDGSPEPDLAQALEALVATGAILLLRNAQNQGFPAGVNRVLAHCAGYDVVLLNADAVVAGDWLARLRRVAIAHLTSAP